MKQRKVQAFCATIGILLLIPFNSLKANPTDSTNEHNIDFGLNISAQTSILEDGATESVTLDDLLNIVNDNEELTSADDSNISNNEVNNEDVPVAAGVTTVMDSELDTELLEKESSEKVIVDFIEIPDLIDCSYKLVEPYEIYVGDTYLRARLQPYTETEDNIFDVLHPGKLLTIIGEREDGWYVIKHKDQICFIASEYLTFEKPISATYNYNWTGEKLNTVNGIVAGPSGNETYYNLNMSHIVSEMKSRGYDWEYWVREDGVKMFGNYIMCAADLNIRPKGSIIESTLGTCIVVDTGGFVSWDNTRLDIAVSW